MRTEMFILFVRKNVGWKHFTGYFLQLRMDWYIQTQTANKDQPNIWRLWGFSIYSRPQFILRFVSGRIQKVAGMIAGYILDFGPLREFQKFY